MLFDVRGGGRRRTIQVVYLTLAVLMAAGLILFGIGGAVSGGLLDAFSSGGGGSSSSGQLGKNVKAALVRTHRHPQQPAAWAALTNARIKLASQGDYFQRRTGTFTPQGQRELGLAGMSWKRYLSLAGKHPNADLAALMVQAYGLQGLRQFADATRAMKVVVDAHPTYGNYTQLAQYAYLAQDPKTAKHAEHKAVAQAPKQERAQIKQQISQIKAAVSGAMPGAKTAPGTVSPKTASPGAQPPGGKHTGGKKGAGKAAGGKHHHHGKHAK